MPSSSRNSKRYRKPLSARWLDGCERIALRLNGNEPLPPTPRGSLLVIKSCFDWVGRKLYPKRFASKMRQRAMERTASRAADARGLTKVTESLEAAATNVSYSARDAGGWLYRLIVPEKFLESLRRFFRDYFVDTYWKVWNFAEKWSKRFMPRWLQTSLRRIGYVGESITAFISAWGKSRDRKKLAFALPAVLLALPLVGAIGASMVYRPASKIRHYQKALSTAIDERDESAERLYFDKLNQLGFRRIDRAEFQSAWALAQEDDKWDEAVARMQAIAPLDEPGYGPAHLWVANQLMRGRIPHADRWVPIETHANHALSLAKGIDRNLRSNARLLLAHVQSQRGNTEFAVNEFQDLSDTMPHLHFDLFRQYARRGDLGTARKHARRVISICNTRQSEIDEGANTSATISSYEYLVWAQAEQFVGDPGRVQPILQLATKKYPEDTSIRQALAALIEPQLATVPESETDAQLDLVMQILRLAPKNKLAADHMVRYAATEKEAARELVNQLIESSALSLELSLRMGDALWAQQDPTGAVWYYEQAAKIDPQSSTAWNNIAWLRGCIEETRDLPTALEAANLAIQLDDSPECFETRGQIFNQLGRWKDAIPDLERALNGALPDSRPAHASLAEALAAVGDKEAAVAHRRQAERSQ